MFENQKLFINKLGTYIMKIKQLSINYFNDIGNKDLLNEKLNYVFFFSVNNRY